MVYMKVWNFFLGARAGRFSGVKVFRVTCSVACMKIWGFLLGARVGGVVGVRVFRGTCGVGYMMV